jgi:DoxX-like family
MLKEMKSRNVGKKTKIIYWIFTSLFAIMMFGSAIPDVFSAQVAIEGFKQMNMPAYLIPFLGFAKVLGVIAILIPDYAKIKEWAYAGLVFDLIGATYSIIASGQPAANYVFMIVPLILAAGSYIFYHKKLKFSASAKTETINSINRTAAIA